jgi:hypothetical protein
MGKKKEFELRGVLDRWSDDVRNSEGSYHLFRVLFNIAESLEEIVELLKKDKSNDKAPSEEYRIYGWANGMYRYDYNRESKVLLEFKRIGSISWDVKSDLVIEDGEFRDRKGYRLCSLDKIPPKIRAMILEDGEFKEKP